jgi:hypothetical protein
MGDVPYVDATLEQQAIARSPAAMAAISNTAEQLTRANAALAGGVMANTRDEMGFRLGGSAPIAWTGGGPGTPTDRDAARGPGAFRSDRGIHDE